jgi:hypothetical protein
VKAPQYLGAIRHLLLPLSFKVGTRISARMQNSNAGTSSYINVAAELFDTDMAAGEAIAGFEDIIGLSGSPPNTITTTPSTPATKTAWTQVKASTARDYCGLLVMLDSQGTQDTTNYPVAVIDIGLGGAGSEVVIVPNLCSAYSDNQPAVTLYVPVSVKAGSRLSQRSSLSGILGGRAIGVALYGAYL